MADAAPRAARWTQASLLIFTSCLSVLGTVLIAPVLPRMQAEFSDVPMVAALTPVVLTIPALMVALLAPVAGNIVMRTGRKPLLIAALALYALAGTAPLWLDNFHLVLLSRLVLGIAEAGVMTCCTTLIADYYDGPRRSRYLAFQAVATSLSASFIVYLGGLLGEAGWRAPFALYSVGVFLMPLAVMLLWEPARGDTTAACMAPAHADRFPWRRLLPIYGLAVVAMLSFFLVPIQGPFLLTEAGLNSPEIIGRIIGGNQLAVFLSAISTPWLLQRLGFGRLLAAAMAITACAFLLLGTSASLTVAVVAMVVAGFGCGVMIPTIMSWTVSEASFKQRPRAVGGATSCLFLGQFLSPLMLMALAAAFGGRLAGIGVWGMVALVTAGLAWWYQRETVSPEGFRKTEA